MWGILWFFCISTRHSKSECPVSFGSWSLLARKWAGRTWCGTLSLQALVPQHCQRHCLWRPHVELQTCPTRWRFDLLKFKTCTVLVTRECMRESIRRYNYMTTHLCRSSEADAAPLCFQMWRWCPAEVQPACNPCTATSSYVPPMSETGMWSWPCPYKPSAGQTHCIHTDLHQTGG